MAYAQEFKEPENQEHSTSVSKDRRKGTLFLLTFTQEALLTIPSPQKQTPKEITGTSQRWDCPGPLSPMQVAVLFAQCSPGVFPSSFTLCCPK